MNTYYHNPSLLIEQFIDADECLSIEEEWQGTELELLMLEKEVEQEAKENHQAKQRTLITQNRRLSHL